jgi:hypothetical protein
MHTPAFCQRLASALAARQITRNDLLHRGGKGFTYRKIHAYCAGTTPPPLEFLVLLGSLGFDIHYLIMGSSAGAESHLRSASAHALLEQVGTILAATKTTLDTLTPVLAGAGILAGEAGVQAGALTLREERLITAFRAAPGQQELVLAMLATDKLPGAAQDDGKASG